jgi:Uma2 family endonuclease
MGMPATRDRKWTAADVRALPEKPGTTYECIDGELIVSPGPSFAHQRVAFELQRLLDAHVRSPRVAYVLNGPGEIEPDPFTLVQPDIFVAAPVNGRCPIDSTTVERLYLVVEVLSPSSGRTDRVKKRGLYQRMGVEYWIVDHAARLVERWHPHDERAELIDSRIVWTCSGFAEPLTIDLDAVFTEALDS